MSEPPIPDDFDVDTDPVTDEDGRGEVGEPLPDVNPDDHPRDDQ